MVGIQKNTELSISSSCERLRIRNELFPGKYRQLKLKWINKLNVLHQRLRKCQRFDFTLGCPLNYFDKGIFVNGNENSMHG